MNDKPGPNRIFPNIGRRLFHILVFPKTVIIKASLPQWLIALQHRSLRHQFTLEQANEVNDISILEKQMNVLRHDAPGIWLRSTIRSQLHEELKCLFSQLRIFRKPRETHLRAYGDRKGVALLIRSRGEADLLS